MLVKASSSIQEMVQFCHKGGMEYPAYCHHPVKELLRNKQQSNNCEERNNQHISSMSMLQKGCQVHHCYNEAHGIYQCYNGLEKFKVISHQISAMGKFSLTKSTEFFEETCYE